MAVALMAVLLGAPTEDEVDGLASLIGLADGMTVAEVGAGTGWLSVEIARRVGASGRVFSTELSTSRLTQIRGAAAEAGLTNVTVVEAGEQSSNLPPGCCDAIFMRRVYHHLSDPASVMADLSRALKPGGQLVIVEFESSGFLGMLTRMGTDRASLANQVTAAGFELVEVEEWPAWGHFVAVFRRSAL